MKIIKWKLLDAYKLQTAKDNERSQVYLDRIAKAREKVTAVTATRELLLRREAIERVNLSSELSDARREMAIASEELRMAQEDSTKIQHIVHEANAVDPDRITLLKLVRSWQTEYEPMIRREQLDPIKERIANAKAEYLTAIVEYYELKNEVTRYYADDHDSLRGVRNERGDKIFTAGLHWMVHRELKLINDHELSEAQFGRLPLDIVLKRKKGEEE